MSMLCLALQVKTRRYTTNSDIVLSELKLGAMPNNANNKLEIFMISTSMVKPNRLSIATRIGLSVAFVIAVVLFAVAGPRPAVIAWAVGECVCIAFLLGSSATQLYTQLEGRMRFRLHELIIVVSVLGSGLGVLASECFAIGYSRIGLLTFSMLGVVILGDVVGGAVWAFWVSTLLNIENAFKRAGVLILGWVFVPAWIGLLYSIGMILAGLTGGADPTAATESSLCIGPASAAIIYFTWKLQKKARVAHVLSKAVNADLGKRP